MYFKPTHTDQHLQWDSHHNLSATYSVIGTLTHRAKTVCNTLELLNEELQHLREALERCKYPRWAINKIQNKVINGSPEGNGNNSTQVGNSTQGTSTSSSSGQVTASPRGRPSIEHIVIPYIQGLGENIKHICTKYGIQTYFKGNSTFKQMLIRPKDQDPREKKIGVIYSYQCGAINCGEEYIGETSRTLGGMLQGTSEGTLPIQVHSQLTGHQLSPNNFNILGREGQDLTRLMKESIYIRVNNPTLNRNIGKFHLNHIWERVFLSTPNLKVALP